MNGTPFKKCTCCGRAYDRAAWARLRFIGLQADDVEVLEMRDCACLSTLAVVLAPVPRTARPALETAVAQ